MSTLGISGRDGWHRMRGTPEERAGQVRLFILNTPGNRFAADRGNQDRQLLATVRNRFPEMVEELGEAAILALTRNLGPGTCSWCAAAQIAGRDLEPTPARQIALGSMCAKCLRRRDKAESADSESAHLRELSEAGLSLAAAGRLRTPEQIRRQAEGIRRLREAPPPMKATGWLWAAGPEPPAVTASVQAALHRRAPPAPTPPPAIAHKTPIPHYYIPNRRRWPDDR